MASADFQVKKALQVLGTGNSNFAGPIYSQGNLVLTSVSAAVKQLIAASVPAISGTTSIPFDNTTPINTEGTSVFAVVLTPTSIGANILIQVSLTAAVQSNNRHLVFAVFRNSVCVGATAHHFPNGNSMQAISLQFIDNPGSLTAQTYSCRVGIAGGGGSWYINQSNVALFNGSLAENGYALTEF